MTLYDPEKCVFLVPQMLMNAMSPKWLSGVHSNLMLWSDNFWEQFLKR